MRAVVTVVGKDRTGIIAKVSNVLYECNSNILDISQTVLQDHIFTMIMLVDLEGISVPFSILKEKLDACAKEIGLSVQIQREEIFESMHRI